MRTSRWLPWLIVVAVSAPLIFRTQTDPDLWGHVRFGLDAFHSHWVPLSDPYSFTQDVPWINHEWLSELVMGVAYQGAGIVGLAVLKGSLVFLIFVLVLGVYTNAAFPAAAAAFLLLAVGTGRVTSTLRPQLWSLLAFAVLCRLLMATPRRGWLLVFPVLFAVWTNVHGGWTVGAAVLAIWVAAHFWQRGSSKAFLVGLASLSALGTLINPYGWQMWQFLGTTIRPSRAIVEWQPLLTTPPVAWIPWMLVALGLMLTPLARKRPPLDRVLTVALLGIGAFRVERLSPFFIIAALILMSPTICEQWPARAPALRPLSRRTAIALVTACLTLVLMSATLTVRAASCIPISGDWVPDRVAGRALTDAHINGKIVTWFDWGEYAIWHLGPAVRVSLDGRRETVYSDAVLENHDQINAGTPQGLAYLKSLDPDYVWLPARVPNVADWLTMHGYRIDVQTPRSFVAVRSSLPVVKVSDAPTAACFPGP